MINAPELKTSYSHSQTIKIHTTCSKNNRMSSEFYKVKHFNSFLACQEYNKYKFWNIYRWIWVKKIQDEIPKQKFKYIKFRSILIQKL